MNTFSVHQITEYLSIDPKPDALLSEIRESLGAKGVLRAMRKLNPPPDPGALSTLPATTYTRYREFERNGKRDGYQKPYYAKRAWLALAVLENILEVQENRDLIHDLLWSICEETSWVLPAHEEQGPRFWELKPSPRKHPWGAHTALTRHPDSIDLFAAETGASLAEAIYLLGEQLAPEVCQRVRQEVERRIFHPYLAYGRDHWWYRGALNWNGVCNGAIGLAFMRLAPDPRTLAEALAQVLEGLDAYIATGFEPDGGSIEGISYWNYGLMYYVTLAELLRQRTGGKIDLMADPRLQAIARYPLVTALSKGIFVNFGDAQEEVSLEPGIVTRLAERTGTPELKGLLSLEEPQNGESPTPLNLASAKLSIVLRDAAWWDGAVDTSLVDDCLSEKKTLPLSATAKQVYADAYLPDCAIVKFAGKIGVVEATDKTLPDHSLQKKNCRVILVAKAGHNDGHHSHTDIGHLILHVHGESLLCDPGRGLYSREYFRQERYQNFFNNSLSHSVPRIAGALQSPGPEFSGKQLYRGEIIEVHNEKEHKSVTIDLHQAYDLPQLQLARRKLSFNSQTGRTLLEDVFAFQGSPDQIEEAFVTWNSVSVAGETATITGNRSQLLLRILEPAGGQFEAESRAEDCRINQRDGVITRLICRLPAGSLRYTMEIIPAINLRS